jgi:transposase
MPRRSLPVQSSDEERNKIDQLARSRAEEARLVQRARIIRYLLEGKSVAQTARELNTRPNTVIEWRRRFQGEGTKGLCDRSRPGKPIHYGKEFRDTVLKTLEMPPPDGLAVWDGPALAQYLNASVHAVWRLLRKEGICLQRQRTWCVSTDREFVPKAADIVGLYLNPPENAMVLCVDEKPSMQALERKTGYVLTDNGKLVRGLKSTYKRHGTLNLFAALEVATGSIHTQTTKQKRRVEFLDFMERIVTEYPLDTELHVVLDNYCIHKRNDEWLIKHPNVTFHYTPTSASWLNQVEIWFGIMSRKVLRGASFRDTQELGKAIEAFVNAYKKTAKPFAWRKREVKGSQLKNTIVNLHN